MKLARKSYITHVESFQVDQGSVRHLSRCQKDACIEKRTQINLFLKKQHQAGKRTFFKLKIVRGKFFMQILSSLKSEV